MRRHVLVGAFLLPIALSGSPVHAGILFSGWYYTGITGPAGAPLESALLAEGILYDTIPGSAGAPTYDYIFEVANRGSFPIAAFAGGIGGGAGANIEYNSDFSFGLPGLPAAGPTNLAAVGLPITQQTPAIDGKRLPGGWGGANNPFRPAVFNPPGTPYSPLYPGPGVKYLTSPNYQYWGFEISDTVPGFGNGYGLGWYNLVGNQLFTTGLVTRFDLNSIFGPVAGGAFLDPPSDPPSDYIIDWNNGGLIDTISLATPDILDPMTSYCGGSGPNAPGSSADCTDFTDPNAVPTGIAALNYSGYGVPEPSTLGLLGSALFALGSISFWRRRVERRRADILKPKAAIGG
ncbi:MAG TPA: PEP-CTERM sorting domain-containing protein [Rhizomicrobium sp.]|nr:PEP-CTERM sorting domain-containing protein [Rhizomicrobium sp.]